MEKNLNTTGYIEGYYGKLLNWEQRKLIIKTLKKNEMNTYFYAPKEDIKHRLCWRDKYDTNWRSNFSEFNKFSKKNNVNVIAGIAPGLDFNFNIFKKNFKLNNRNDFDLLYYKAEQLINDGASSIALLLDDIPSNFKKKFGINLHEGKAHGLLANKLSQKLNRDIYFVPRIYADELIRDEPEYLYQLSTVLNPKIKIFYCGKNIVSKSIKKNEKIKKLFPNEIIFWDNYYSNDYCPRRLFIGPFKGRKSINNIMINPTGLIWTDILILDLFASNFNCRNSIKEWEKILNNHGVPKTFIKLKKFFLKPDFGSNPLVQKVNISNKDFEALDFLLWKWKGKLSREWYPLIFGLKQDLQINKKLLTSERKIKTQTAPLSEFLLKGELE